MLRSFLSEIKSNYLYYILAFGLFASSTPIIPNGMIFYVGGIIYILLYILKDKKLEIKKTIFLLFLASCYLSSLIKFTFDYRLLVFSITILACTPIFSSRKIFIFREKYLKYCLFAFPVISLISLYCYFAGINMMSKQDGDVSWDFSAIFPHSMWLGAAVGIANVVSLWLIYSHKSIFLKLFWTLQLLTSIYISVVSASRSALLSSLLTMILLVLTRVNKVTSLIKVIAIIAIIVSLSLSYFIGASTRMQAKMDTQGEGQYGSRSEHFTSGFKHFNDSPIVGAGYAVMYFGNQRMVGRIESGSGWFSILFQTGTLGAVIMLAILFRIEKNIKYLRVDKNLQLYFFSFLFLCFHSFFEGYILTSGYYLCILFWMLLGYLYMYPNYRIVSLVVSNNNRKTILSKTNKIK